MAGWKTFETLPEIGDWICVYGEKSGDDEGFWVSTFEWRAEGLLERDVAFKSYGITPLLWRERYPEPRAYMIARARLSKPPEII